VYGEGTEHDGERVTNVVTNQSTTTFEMNITTSTTTKVPVLPNANAQEEEHKSSMVG